MLVVIGHRDWIGPEGGLQLPGLRDGLIETNRQRRLHHRGHRARPGFHQTLPANQPDEKALIGDRKRVFGVDAQGVVGQTQRRYIDRIPHEPKDPIGGASHDDHAGLSGATQTGTRPGAGPVQPRPTWRAEHEERTIFQVVDQLGYAIDHDDTPTETGKIGANLVEDLTRPVDLVG